MENLCIKLEENSWADQSRKEFEQQIPSLDVEDFVPWAKEKNQNLSTVSSWLSAQAL